MTHRERFLTCLHQGIADRVSVANAVSIATVDLMQETGCWFPDAHLNADAMAGLAASGHDILGYDTIAPVFSVQQEAAALGCRVDWGRKDLMPDVDGKLCHTAEDVRIPDDLLDHPACRVVLDALRLLRRRYPDVALVGKVFGPWTLAYHLFGVQDFLMMTIDDPGQVGEVLRRLQPVAVLFAEAQLEAGADVITLGDHATGDLVSAGMYREMLWPIHRELAQAISGPVILHICGNTADRLADIAHTGFASFHFDSRVPAARARQIVDGEGLTAAGDRMVTLMGNINNPDTLLRGRPEDVAREVRECLAQGIEIIGPECAVPLTTPTENLRAITDAVLAVRDE